MEQRKAFDQFVNERISEVLEQMPSRKAEQDADRLESIFKDVPSIDRRMLENLMDYMAEASAEEYRAVYLGGLLDGVYLRFLS